MKNSGFIFLLTLLIFTLSACSFGENSEVEISSLDEPVSQVTASSHYELNDIEFTEVEPYTFTATNSDRIIYDSPRGDSVKTFDKIGEFVITQEAVDSDGVKWGELESGDGWIKFDGSVLPALEMTFASGAGAWRTWLKISSDGTFEGVYLDSDMGDAGAEYPKGTKYCCEFDGKFKDISIVDSYTLSLPLDYLNINTPTGETEYKDDFRYIYTGPHGMADCEEFFLYLPGKDISGLSESFRNWVKPSVDEESNITDRYTLHNISAESGFLESVSS